MSSPKPIFSQGDKIRDYEIVAQIKPGTRNSVYKAFIPGNEKHYYAIKVFPYQEEDDIDAFNNEVALLENFASDDSIISHKENFTIDILISSSEEKDDDDDIEVNYTFMCTVMDFCEEIDLLSYFYSFQVQGTGKKASLKPLKIDIVRMILFKTLKILNEVHSKGIVHHDIKPENFLIKSTDPFDLVLTDFEFAVQLMEDERIQHPPCGTVKYMAPEILNEELHDQKADIWSLAVMIYYFAFGFYPCMIKEDDAKNKKFLEIVKDKVNKYHKKISFGHDRSETFQSFKDLLKKMLTYDQDERISAEDALMHEFLADFNDLENETKADINEFQIEFEGTEKYDNGQINEIP